MIEEDFDITVRPDKSKIEILHRCYTETGFNVDGETIECLIAVALERAVADCVKSLSDIWSQLGYDLQLSTKNRKRVFPAEIHTDLAEVKDTPRPRKHRSSRGQSAGTSDPRP